MNRIILKTPLGDIMILLDGETYPCRITRLESDCRLCRDIDGRYKIEVDYTPDGREHVISCVLVPTQDLECFPEHGERLECWGYYNENESIKVSIGIESDSSYFYDAGKLVRDECDYDYDGSNQAIDGLFYNSYEILPITKTNHFVFGIAWIVDCNEENEIQTNFGADPTMM